MKERNKCKINGNIEKYRHLRNRVSRLIESAKHGSIRTKIEEGKSDPRSVLENI